MIIFVDQIFGQIFPHFSLPEAQLKARPCVSSLLRGIKVAKDPALFLLEKVEVPALFFVNFTFSSSFLPLDCFLAVFSQIFVYQIGPNQ